MKTRSLFNLTIMICLLAVQAALSLEVPKQPKGRVNDYAGILAPREIASLEDKLRRFERETTNQIAVAIFKSLDGESLEDFSIRLDEQWGVGMRLRDNGVILLIFLEERRMRIEVGYGLEGALTDATASSIIRNVIAPRFRRGDYFGGIDAGIDKIIGATKGEYRAEPAGEDGERSSPVINYILLFGFILLWALIAGNTRRRGRRFYSFGPSGWSSGSMRRSGWSSGGFSGGGGRFGGGGASGSW